MASELQIHLLQAMMPNEVARLLRQAISTSSTEVLSQRLLEAVERGSISSSIYRIWLSVSRCPVSVRYALRQSISVSIRKSGLLYLHKLLCSTGWRQMWDIIGGTQDWLDLLSDFSVQDVGAVCSLLGRSAKGADVEAKRERFTELLEALFPSLFPDAVHKTPDQRPLTKYYERLVPGFTWQKVMHIWDKAGISAEWRYVSKSAILHYHGDNMQNLTTEAIINKTPLDPLLHDLFRCSPPTTGTIPGFSASMQFSLEILRMLVDKDLDSFPDSDFRNLVEPLIRRAAKKHVELARRQEIVELTTIYFQRHPGAARCFEGASTVLNDVAPWWSRRPQSFESGFATLLRNVYRKTYTVEMSTFLHLFRKVAKSRLYELLKFCFQAVTNRNIDVEEDLKGLPGGLPFELLWKLEPSQALALFTRMRNARGDENLVSPGGSYNVASNSATPNGYHIDSNLIQVLLLYRNGQAEEAAELASLHVEDRKEKSMAMSDPQHRAWYARSANYYATASGSLKILKDLYIWARRFQRDPLTISRFYIYPDGATDILCGFPAKVEQKLSHQTLRSNIEEANSTLQILFDSACAALGEPSFNVDNWRQTLRLFREVVHARIRRSVELSRILQLVVDDAYDLIWKDTIRLLIAIEETGLKDGYERLQLVTFGGILDIGDYYEDQINIENQPPATYRFLDEYAKARDQLWRKFRSSIHSASAVLPEPYPRGLPIQSLMGPFMPMVSNLESLAPYLAGRANAIVFMDPTIASTPFPEDEETMAAIGYFIDDYEFALRLLVPGNLEQEEKRRRINRASAYALGPLSDTRMSRNEAIRYWEYVSQQDLLEYWPRDGRNPPWQGWPWGDWPTVPPVEDPSEVEEWNPVPPQKSVQPNPTKSRTLSQLTSIDVSMGGNFSRRNMYLQDVRSTVALSCSRFRPLLPKIPGLKLEEPDIWSYSRIERAKAVPSIREGQILSALLLLDATNSAKTRILTSSFPSTHEVRYPAIYLDDTILLSTKAYGALEVLQAHIEQVPPSLLVQLTKNTLDALSKADPSEPNASGFRLLQEKAFDLLKLLAHSDRPSLAMELAVQTIIQYPNSSSWHRQLLSPGFFLRLSASDARSCFAMFADAIIAQLDKSKQTTSTKTKSGNVENDDGEEKSSGEVDRPQRQPHVKITTVKFLAQLLRDSKFVPEDFAFEVLTTLLQKASHRDIKRAILDSFLEMLKTSSGASSERILQCLERLIPTIATLNERRPISEADWAAARASVSGPLENILKVDLDFTVENRPMLTSLLKLSIEPPQPEAYTKRIVLPVLTRLKSEMKAWLGIFLSSISVSPEFVEHLPLVPLDLDVWHTILNQPAYFQHIPLSVLEEYFQYQIFCIKSHPAITEINKKRLKHPKLRSTPAAKTWLSLYNRGLGIVDKVSPLLQSLLWDTTFTENGAVTQNFLHKQYLDLFEVVLWNDSPKYKYVRTLMELLEPGYPRPRDGNRLNPLNEAVIAYVESLRTPEWEHSVTRKPVVLPDTFELRLNLLDYLSEKERDIDEAKCKVYAEQLGALVDDIAKGVSYHKKLERIKQRLIRIADVVVRALVGLHLGDIEGKLNCVGLAELLRVELAAELLKFIREYGLTEDEMVGRYSMREVKERSLRLLARWKESDCEEVRKFGFGCL